MKRALFAVIAVITLFGAGCHESWRGFYYPDGTLGEIVRSPYEFDSFESCRTWVLGVQRTHDPAGLRTNDWECGKNCELKDASLDLYSCDETRD